MIENTALVSTPGKMAVNTKVCGTTVNNMEKVSTDRPMAVKEEVAGKTAKEWNG